MPETPDLGMSKDTCRLHEAEAFQSRRVTSLAQLKKFGDVEVVDFHGHRGCVSLELTFCLDRRAVNFQGELGIDGRTGRRGKRRQNGQCKINVGDFDVSSVLSICESHAAVGDADVAREKAGSPEDAEASAGAFSNASLASLLLVALAVRCILKPSTAMASTIGAISVRVLPLRSAERCLRVSRLFFRRVGRILIAKSLISSDQFQGLNETSPTVASRPPKASVQHWKQPNERPRAHRYIPLRHKDRRE